ncbi:DUF6118 family protein [Sphingobium cupriresistens]|uniref:Uncharacterized protein n=1 Tax=Sphingobium cupriresistens TaxID=1132417 RepID=A0A8G1ZCP1_9SPHN|nr:DUF6118 family protein [Sphingobium cupriresistens]RYM06783.1 hypothetical protein EWH12_19880 [Sphingobium cupriresistens]
MDEDEYREPHAGDDPVAAFERLRGEVSLLRHAVEGLTAARENIEIPDYEPTLERTEKILVALAQRIDPIAKSPLLSMTPDSMASQIATAATAARREDARLVAEARAGLDQAAREIGNRLASARRGDEQNRWLYIAGVGGAVLGVFLYALLAGPLARATPDSWRWPERMATRVLNEPGPWEAGQRLMQSAAPESWGLIVAASPLSDANRETVQKCREQAGKAKKPVRCTIEVKAENNAR